MLHHKCSTGLYIGHWKFWNFQIFKAKLEQIIAIVTTHSVFLILLSKSILCYCFPRCFSITFGIRIPSKKDSPGPRSIWRLFEEMQNPYLIRNTVFIIYIMYIINLSKKLHFANRTKQIKNDGLNWMTLYQDDYVSRQSHN